MCFVLFLIFSLWLLKVLISSGYIKTATGRRLDVLKTTGFLGSTSGFPTSIDRIDLDERTVLKRLRELQGRFEGGLFRNAIENLIDSAEGYPCDSRLPRQLSDVLRSLEADIVWFWADIAMKTHALVPSRPETDEERRSSCIDGAYPPDWSVHRARACWRETGTGAPSVVRNRPLEYLFTI